ncbi:hypothetical protein [Marinifilum fragile]|uniref:hypothetical protein n=1 Tax=Marinifilum fragile TaxID=570161 RepID=UPI0006D1C762|nr:hypothetical protein [Marinifilum fragile]
MQIIKIKELEKAKIEKVHYDFCMGNLEILNKLNLHRHNAPQLYDFLIENLENLLIGEKEQLLQIIQLCPVITGNINNELKLIFNYEIFRDNKPPKWGAYSYFKKLGVNACPYCNRIFINPTKRLNRRKLTPLREKFDNQTYEWIKGHNPNLKPDIDHFYSKEKYPYLAISLYNLIPCCTICNSRLKHKRDWTILHPYSDSLDKHYRFTVDFENKEDIIMKEGVRKKDIEQYFGTALLNNKTEVFKINLVPKNGSETKEAFLTKELFFIEELYQNHKDYVLEILKKAQLYNEDYMDSLHECFPDIFSSQEDFLQAYLANYINEDDINKRPLSKLTIDIAKEFGIIK